VSLTTVPHVAGKKIVFSVTAAFAWVIFTALNAVESATITASPPIPFRCFFKEFFSIVLPFK
jgi:hypothetical protein